MQNLRDCQRNKLKKESKILRRFAEGSLKHPSM